MDKQQTDTEQNNFDLLWQIFDERYCYFEEKKIDWEQMYRTYFSPEKPLFNRMATMLEELQDGHVTIDNGSFSRTYSGWHTPYPENFSSSLIRAYRESDRQTKYLNNEMTISVLPESIGYIRCPSFSDKFNRYDLDNAMAKFKEVKGVIIDVRNNGGGLISEAYMFASRFVREKTHVGYVRYKTGKGHNDFSDYFARYVEPDGANPFYGKVVLITNRKVYSAANLFVSIMINLPQVCIMGDNTGGGGGVPISAELYNGWTVKLSTNPVFDVNKKSLETGVKPNHFIELGKDAKNDNIIEAAKEWILAN
jgi:C-terminal processing protease CtpA/Prc